MKICDLDSGKKSFKEAEIGTPASREIRTSLRRAGYRLLGKGADATVWAKSSGAVVKIIMPDDGQGAGIAGDTFMKFYEFCKQNSGLENLPRFSANEVEVFEADGKNYVMVTMERLTPIPANSFEQAIVWLFSNFASQRQSWPEVLAQLKIKKTWTSVPSDLDVKGIIKSLGSLNKKNWLELEILYKLMVLLYTQGKINKVLWDLHTENAMMRGNTIVITDPWFQDAYGSSGP